MSYANNTNAQWALHTQRSKRLLKKTIMSPYTATAQRHAQKRLGCVSYENICELPSLAQAQDRRLCFHILPALCINSIARIKQGNVGFSICFLIMWSIKQISWNRVNKHNVSATLASNDLSLKLARETCRDENKHVYLIILRTPTWVCELSMIATLH